MRDDKTTKPTIETVLERISGLEGRMNERVDTLEGRVNTRVDALEGRINERVDQQEERIGVRLDRIESVADTTRGEMLDLRADFRELRTQIKERFPAVK